MRTFLLSCCLAGLLLAAGGCAFMSDEDRDFYGKGWVNPRELDTPTQHTVPNPEAPTRPAAAPLGTGLPHDSDQGDGWTAPPLN